MGEVEEGGSGRGRVRRAAGVEDARMSMKIGVEKSIAGVGSLLVR